ncbi:hypothetical protein UZ36_03930 [Candidatus Nitromaritima sp. SCGC AAA799-C22]|nr:hypothetical protein UZ36_03930 [Candidatus Nitromaritima sp. SCGC AAA799-C22]
MARPFADLTARFFLNERIRGNITRLKQADPRLVIGETHCHSIFSDGQHAVNDILTRSASLGLDYVVITEHLLPGKFTTGTIIASIQEQARCLSERESQQKPVKVYPAFELSALEGHLILIFDPYYLDQKKCQDISLLFSQFDYRFMSMLDAIPRIADMGGISIVAHPGRIRAYPFGAPVSWVKENLLGLVDGIEDISSGHGYEENYSRELGLASIGSSDDHFNLLTGTAVTAYDGTRHKDLITAVRSRETQALTVENSLQSFLKGARRVL